MLSKDGLAKRGCRGSDLAGRGEISHALNFGAVSVFIVSFASIGFSVSCRLLIWLPLCRQEPLLNLTALTLQPPSAKVP